MQYSTDLRVRYANADLNLALDGWHKNGEAAGLLIERPQTDLKYRPAAVYFLGMLAGRGVAYDKIHPVLLEYAKNDSDPNVRPRAVEGMRYLGTDEALDELVESVTQEASMDVRDRAGCNIPIAEVSNARSASAWCRTSSSYFRTAARTTRCAAGALWPCAKSPSDGRRVEDLVRGTRQRKNGKV
jgi:hypothetical protein